MFKYHISKLEGVGGLTEKAEAARGGGGSQVKIDPKVPTVSYVLLRLWCTKLTNLLNLFIHKCINIFNK